ncbi:MAG: hypothetical protein ABSH31_00330 [Bryobacteraceae bacterium]
MLTRVLVLCAFGFAAGATSAQAQDVFVLPGAGSSSELVSPFTASPLSVISTFNSGMGAFLTLTTPDGTKFYTIADSTGQTITSTDANFLNPVNVANLPAPATAAVITPDGSVLAVAAGALYLFNTTTNAQTLTGGFSQGPGIHTFDMAASLDASALYLLGSTPSGTSQLTAFDIATGSAAVNLAIPQPATAVTVGPNGLVYVSLPDQILELDPRTLKTTPAGAIAVSGTPGRLAFTPDGQYAVTTNQTLLASSTLLIVALGTHAVTAPDLGLPLLGNLSITGIDSVGGFANGSVYEITISNTVSASVFQVPGFGILGFTTSNEVPTAANPTVHNLYAVTTSFLYRISPATDDIVDRYPLESSVSPGALSFTAPALLAPASSPATLLTYGTNQTVPPSTSSEPLVVQVLDLNNHPIKNVTVQFQSSSTGATLSSTSVTTLSNGYALTYLTAPAAVGPITVTATVGSLTANFNLNVSTAGGANGPVLTILAGQGQLLNADTNTGLGVGSPLKVLVSDSKGNPLAGVPITFSVPPALGSIVVNGVGGTSVNSGADGTAQVDFQTTNLPTNTNVGYFQASVTVTAAVNGQATNPVIFYITTVGEIPSPTVRFLAPAPGVKLTGPAGGILPDAVTAAVYSDTGWPIPNVSLTLNDGNLDPSAYPTASCNAPAGQFVLTNTSGLATCDVLFGPRVGPGSFTPVVGYTESSFSTQFMVTAGAAADVQITQGNNQVGTPGETLPQALLIKVTDADGNAVPNIPVTWQVLTAGAVTLRNASTTTDSLGSASATAILGNIGGVAQVQVTAGNVSATFNLTVNIPTAGLQKVSGDKQSTVVNTAFTLPLTVAVVDSSGTGIAGVSVNFQVTSGTATLGSSSASTGSNGQAYTAVTAGATPGTITVSATSGGFSATFTLTAQPSGPANITIVNGASFNKGTGVSPGGIATISGTGFLTGVTGLVTANNAGGSLPTTLGGVTVSFGTPAAVAPIYYVLSANGTDEVTVQVPFEVQPGSSVALTLSVTNGGSATVMIPVKPFAPGIFTTVFDGKIYPVVLRPDGSVVSPNNPAQLGEDLTFYVTGLGQVMPPAVTGEPGVSGQSIVAPLIVGLNNGGVPLISAAYVPGSIGVYVVKIQVPADTKTGPYQPLGIVAFDSANKAYYANSTYLPIE